MNETERKEYLVKLGSRIKQLRLEREMSQEELAIKSGYGSRSTINKIELGINDVSQSKILAIARALNVTVGDILCIDNSENVKVAKPLDEMILDAYGQSVFDAHTLYVQLDTEDQAEIRGEMKQMLKSDKYQQDGLKNA